MSTTQKEILTRYKLNPDNWRVIFESKTTLEVTSNRSGRRRVLEKKRKR